MTKAHEEDHARRVGLAPDEGAGTISLRVGPQHLNPGQRLHGALSMSLHEIACASAAAQTCGEVSRLIPLSSHYEFLAAAAEGDDVRATATVSRASRTLLFLSSVVSGPKGDLSRATVIHGLGEPAAAGACVPAMPLPADFVVSPRPRDPYATLLGPLHEAASPAQSLEGALQVQPWHCTARQPYGGLHGMRLLADLFLGRAAHRAANGRPVVTLGLTLNYLRPVPVGAAVRVSARLDGATALTASVSARFDVGDQPVMQAAGLWKIVGTG